MHIVQVEDFFHPEAGYQINIISKIFVQKGHTVTILTAEMDKTPEYLKNFFGSENIKEKDSLFQKKYGVKIIRLPVLCYISGRVIFKCSLVKAIKSQHPDIVFLHDNDKFSSIVGTCLHKHFGCPVILDSHMLEMASKNRFAKQFRLFYKYCITPIIKRNSIPVIRIQDDEYVNKYLGIPEALTPFISVGTDTSLFHPDEKERLKFINKYNLPEDSFLVLYAGKIDESKGSDLLLELLSLHVAETNKICFIIIGNEHFEIDSFIEENKESFVWDRILRFPAQKYEDLATFYQVADIAIYPRQCSLSFYDVQACGVPVVFEDNEVNKKRAMEGAAFCYESGNSVDFYRKIENLSRMHPKEFSELCWKATNCTHQKYDYATICDEYLKIMDLEI